MKGTWKRSEVNILFIPKSRIFSMIFSFFFFFFFEGGEEKEVVSFSLVAEENKQGRHAVKRYIKTKYYYRCV